MKLTLRTIGRLLRPLSSAVPSRTPKAVPEGGEVRSVERFVPGRHQPRTLDVLAVNRLPEWRAVLSEGRWQEGVDYGTLLDGTRLLILGDTNHSRDAAYRALIAELPRMTAAGITTLSIELPENLQDVPEAQAATGTWTEHLVEELLTDARALGLDVLFTDMGEDEQRRLAPETRPFARGVHMGQRLATHLAQHPDAVAVHVTGFAHLDDEAQTRAQLHATGQTFRSAAFVGAAQHGAVGFLMEPLTRLSVVQAVEELAPEGRRTGVVACGGLNLPFDSVLHFDAPALQGTPSSAQPMLWMERPVEEPPPDGPLALVKVGQIGASHARVFVDRIEDDSDVWSVSNEQRVWEFVQALDGLSMGQRLCLMTALNSHLEHLDRIERSINGHTALAAIEFDAKRQLFAIRRLDDSLLGQTLSDARYSEVKLARLFEQTDIAPLLHGLHDLPLIPIANHPDRPEALPKIALLALARKNDPDRIGIWSEFGRGASDVRVLARTRPGPREDHADASRWVVRLTLRDFALTDIEERLDKLSDRLSRRNDTRAIDRLVYFDVERRQSSGGERWRELRSARQCAARIREASHALNTWALDSYGLGASSLILRARSELRCVSSNDLERLAEHLTQGVRLMENGLDAAKSLVRAAPSVSDLTWTSIVDPNRPERFQTVLEEAEASLETLKSDLVEVRSLQAELAAPVTS